MDPCVAISQSFIGNALCTLWAFAFITLFAGFAVSRRLNLPGWFPALAFIFWISVAILFSVFVSTGHAVDPTCTKIIPSP